MIRDLIIVDRETTRETRSNIRNNEDVDDQRRTGKSICTHTGFWRDCGHETGNTIRTRMIQRLQDTIRRSHKTNNTVTIPHDSKSGFRLLTDAVTNARRCTDGNNQHKSANPEREFNEIISDTRETTRESGGQKAYEPVRHCELTARQNESTLLTRILIPH